MFISSQLRQRQRELCWKKLWFLVHFSGSVCASRLPSGCLLRGQELTLKLRAFPASSVEIASCPAGSVWALRKQCGGPALIYAGASIFTHHHLGTTRAGAHTVTEADDVWHYCESSSDVTGHLKGPQARSRWLATWRTTALEGGSHTGLWISPGKAPEDELAVGRVQSPEACAEQTAVLSREERFPGPRDARAAVKEPEELAGFRRFR